MKKFKFNLQPVMRLREQEEKLRQKAFAEAMERLKDCRGRMAESLGAMEETFASMKASGCGELDMDHIRNHRRLLNYLDARVARLSAEHAELAGEAEGRRCELVEASRRRKAMENLRARRLAGHRYAAAREEGKYYDEVGGTRKALALREETTRRSRAATEGKS